MERKDILKLEAFFKKKFKLPTIEVKQRAKKDSAEVFIGDEFIGTIYPDDEDDGSFSFTMAILDIDLE